MQESEARLVHGGAGQELDSAAEATGGQPAGDASEPSQIPEEMMTGQLFVEEQASAEESSSAQLKAIIEAAVYITDEPLSAAQIATALGEPVDRVSKALDELTSEYSQPGHGLTIREVAGGYKMGTKPEHHEAIRSFVKNLKPPLKLSLPALETLAVVAYKQPVTAPEILEIRGVQGAGVLKTLIDRKLIAPSGRKNVIGKPILYKTTKEFLVQFGLKDVSELPTLKEFEELGKYALSEVETTPEGTEQALAPDHPSESSDPEAVAGPAAEPVDAEDPEASR